MRYFITVAFLLFTTVYALAATVHSPAFLIKTPHFLFRFNADGRGIARNLSRNAESDRTYVLHFLGIKAPQKITVIIAATQREMSEATGNTGRVEKWIAGMAIPGRNLVIISTRGNEVFSARETFLHELGHIYLHIAVNNRPLPRWFDEGFAMYVSGEPVLNRLKTLLPAAAMDNLFKLSDLTWHFPAQGPAVQMAYAQSMMFVRHLFNIYGKLPVLALVDNLSKGLLFEAAFRRAFGVDLVFVEKEFRKNLTSESYLLIVLTGSGVIWLVIAMILIWVYINKRRQDTEMLNKWQEEDENLLASYLAKLSDKEDPPQA